MRPSALLPAALALLCATPASPQSPRTRNVILVTLDGVRIEEFFGGMDTIVTAREEDSGVYDLARLRRDYWRDTPEERRRAVMPFFWDSLAPRGVVFGNQARGSIARISNPHGFSAPGYQEILTGRVQPDVTSNDPVRYPHVTVLEYLARRLGLAPHQVAVFGSWENFRYYAASREGAVFVNAGYDSMPERLATPAMRELAILETRALALWEGSRLDAFTGAMALHYIRRHQPRVVYIAMNDTDDLAHSRRYDRLLDALHALDLFLRDLWRTVEARPAYRGRTTLVITTDHGRGRTPRDWTDHGEGVPGSSDIWAVVVGPDTPPVGEMTGGFEVRQEQVAATLLRCLGMDRDDWDPGAAPPIPGGCGTGD